MKRVLIAVFTANNCRLVKDDPAKWERATHAVVEPDLSAVAGVPPHYWARKDGKIVPMSDEEKAARDAHIAVHGAQNNATPIVMSVVPKLEHKRSVRIGNSLLAFAGGLIVGMIIGALLAW